jgi:DNA repair photolyase
VLLDADLLAGMRACVALTLTTLDERLSRKLEPSAPLPKERLAAMKNLADLGVPVSARIDPIIPGINDGEIEGLVAAASGAGAKHITSSTYKARPANLLRIISAFPEEGEDLKKLFARGEVISASSYLPAEIRRDLMQRMRECAESEGLTSSTCREGSAPSQGVHCDGSHLLSIKKLK